MGWEDTLQLPYEFTPMKDHNFSRWRPHPWHGLDLGDDAPRIVNAYIEITPFDVIKYEIDKVSGYLRVDRPQRSSSHPPALYGFIPTHLLRCAHRETGAGLREGRRRSARHLRGQRAAHRALRSAAARARDRRHQAHRSRRGRRQDHRRARGRLRLGSRQGHLAAARRCWSSAWSTTSAPTSWCRASLTRCRSPASTATNTPRR